MEGQMFVYQVLLGLTALFFHGVLFSITGLMKDLGSEDYAETTDLALRENAVKFANKLRRLYLGYTTIIFFTSLPIIYQVSKDHNMVFTAIASIYFTLIVFALTMFASLMAVSWERHRDLIELLVGRLRWSSITAGVLLALMFMKFTVS